MKCSALLFLSILSLPVLACSHPRTASDATQATTDEETQGQAEAKEDDAEAEKQQEPKPPTAAKPRPAASPEKAGTQQPEVATSARGLFKPGAEDKVREKLGLKGDASTRGPLQRFQKEHDLPATGMLDHETAKRLGLNPDDIFESTQSP
jgi:hypothetical protein